MGVLPNLAEVVLRHGVTSPRRVALSIHAVAGTGVERATYAELARRVGAFRAGLRRARLVEGAPVAALLPVSVDLYALALAAMAEGMPVVLLDGRLSPARLVRALRAARPRAVVSVPALLRRWPLLPPLWRARRFVRGGRLIGAAPLEALLGPPSEDPIAAGGPRPALVGFTSGTGGALKVISRSHDVLLGQHAALRAQWPDRDGDVHLTSFPAVALHVLACGATAVLPPVDLREPGRSRPARLAGAIRTERATRLTLSPALLAALAGHLSRAGETLPSVREHAAGGGPVPRRLCGAARAALPHAEGWVVYGASEAEPIAAAPMVDVLGAGPDGFLVGAPVAAADVTLAGAPARGADAVREIAVRGPQVVPPVAAEAVGAGYRRTGDLGWWDGGGRLWLAGRAGDEVVHRGDVLHPFRVEAPALEVAAVRAAALVAHRAAPEGELAIEPEGDAADAVAAVRRALGGRLPPTLPVRAVDAIPMDARHGSKVDRPALRARLEARR